MKLKIGENKMSYDANDISGGFSVEMIGITIMIFVIFIIIHSIWKLYSLFKLTSKLKAGTKNENP